MDNKADKIIQNIGAAAEATALFYNTLAKEVPSNVALELTKQYMAGCGISAESAHTDPDPQYGDPICNSEGGRRGQKKNGTAAKRPARTAGEAGEQMKRQLPCA